MESRRIELVCGVLAGALGLTALGVGLFAPLVPELTDCGFANPPPPGPCPIVYRSAVQLQGLASLWLPITLYGGLSLGIVLFAVWHSLARSLLVLVLLWVCTVLFWLATLALLHNVLSVFFFPADVLALAASIAGTRTAQQRVPAPG